MGSSSGRYSLPLEVCSMIVACADIEVTSALALTSRKVLRSVDAKRYETFVVPSASVLANLCDTLCIRPKVAEILKCLVFDWKCDEIIEDPELRSWLHQKVVDAFARATKLTRIVFAHLPPNSFVAFLEGLSNVFCSVSTIEIGSGDLSFSWDGFDAATHIKLLLSILHNVKSLKITAPVPRGLLRHLIAQISSADTPTFNSVVITVPLVDFGVIQEITYLEPEAKSKGISFKNLTIMGPFIDDPYESVRVRVFCSIDPSRCTFRE
ncbi:hypothetical protein DL93DRAFT_1230631 [Clavulina sp. PMI_390]|nr:hypothetical protein DL93DRAFT_1230631 [Clavulina sp. PMI_390]